MHVQIETNGTLFPEFLNEPSFQSSVICSPKTGSINPKLIPHIDALKYVIDHNNVHSEDGLPKQALGHPASPRLARPPIDFQGRVYVQPVDSGDAEENKKHLKATIDSCMIYGYTLGLQLHKIIGME